MTLKCTTCPNNVDVYRERKAQYSEDGWDVFYRCYSCRVVGVQFWQVEKWKAYKASFEAQGPA